MKKNRLLILTLFMVIFFAGFIPYLYSKNQSTDKMIITGEGLNLLDSPNGATTDDQNVYIANSNKNTISVFNLKGQFQYPIGKFGENDGELKFPVDVEVYKNQLFVADLGNNRIQIFTKEGRFLDLFPRERNIKPAAISIAFDKVYVSDVYSQTIKIYSLTGKLLKEFGSKGNGMFHYANGITVLENGDIVVSDSQDHNVQVYNSEGVFKQKLGKNEELGFPKGVTVEQGSILVADALKRKIYRFSSDGQFKGEVHKKLLLQFPTDVSVSKNYSVITDNGKNEVILIRRD